MQNSKNLNEEIWTLSSDSVRTIKEKGPVSRHLRNILLNLTKEIEFKSILDIGSGDGTVLNFLHHEYPKVKCRGIDISDKAVDLATKNYPDLQFYVSDISKNYPKIKSDLVICLDVIEHIVNDDLVLENIRRGAKRYFILSTILGRMRNYEKVGGHVRNYNYDEILSRVENHDFKIMKAVRWGFPFYSPLYRDLLVAVNFIGKIFNRKNGKHNSMGFVSSSLIMSLASIPIYKIMKMNIFNKGDHLFLLAQVKSR